MKIAILTITDGANYGNRLQNYAMQLFLEQMGYNVDTIRCVTYRDIKGLKKIYVIAKDYVKKVIGKKKTNFYYRKRKQKFEKFNHDYISFSKFTTLDGKKLKRQSLIYDYFICGSDQIWNVRFPTVRCNILNHLAFFVDGNKRVAVAASFGTDNVPEECKDIFERELKKFKAISVREDAGKNIIEELIDRKDVEVLIDPTLLIKSDDWAKIEKKPNYIKKKRYIVTYFLGKINQNMKQYIYNLASEKNLEVVNIHSEFFFDNEIINYDEYLTTPNEFIWLIHNADYVLTDSFHATVFSILFRKSFLVYQRIAIEKENDMNSRIDTLLSKFALNSSKDDIDNPHKLPFLPDYSGVNNLLQQERKKALSFIRDAFYN